LHPFARRFSLSKRHRPPSLGGLAFIVVATALLCLVPAWPAARAQTFDATNLEEPVDLGATWLVHAGDDPAYADPKLDDLHWTPFDPHSSITTIFWHSTSGSDLVSAPRQG